MSTRPDTLKVLQKVVDVAKSQLSRLESAAAEAAAAITGNTTLTDGDIGIYKEAVKTAQKLTAAFTKATEVNLPAGQLSPPRRGRPPKAKAAGDAPAKPKAAKAATSNGNGEASAKKRGRPAKATAPVAEAAPATPKKRGRPPKAQAAADAPAVESTPKKRGRPPKPKADAAAAAAN